MHGDYHPQVTVLMPAYNAERYVGDAIKSILNQTFTDFELLVVDDGSTDRTLEILNSFVDPRIRIIGNNGNRGIVYSLNKGINLAKGVFVARMDTDDISASTRLMKQYRYLSNHPDVALCGCGMVTFNEHRIISKIYYSLGYDSLKAETLFNSPFPHPGVMVRREVLANNPYRAEALHAEDYDLWSRLLRSHRGINLPHFLLQYRISPDNLTALANTQWSERKRIISDIHQRNFSYLGYQPDPTILNLHFQLSTTDTIKHINFDDHTVPKIKLYIRDLAKILRQKGYCSQYSFYKVCGKIFIKLLVYNIRRMSTRDFLSILGSIYLWVGLIDFVVLRFKYIWGIMKKDKE